MPTTPPTRFDAGDVEFWQQRRIKSLQVDRIARSTPLHWMDAYDLSEEQAILVSRPYRRSAWQIICPIVTEAQKDDLFRQKDPTLIEEFGDKPFEDTDQTWEKVLSTAAPRLVSHKSETEPSHKLRRKLPDGTYLQRGPRLCEQEILERVFRGEGLRFGPLQLGESSEALAHHYCVVGMPRSGKTVLIRLLLDSYRLARVVVYDDKTNLLSGICLDEQHLHILNPFDRRSSAWDIAADADSTQKTAEIARLLIPERQYQQPYFLDTPRLLLAGVMDALNAISPRDWSFLDLLLSAEPSDIREILRRHEPGRRLVETHLAGTDDRTGRDLLSTLQGQLAPYKPIAAAWERAELKVSLAEWAGGSDCDLVLGNHDSNRAAMAAINRVLFQLISESLLDVQTRNRGPRPTLIVLDELEQLGKLESLAPLMNKGTSLGVTLVLGFHDIQALKEHYGNAAEGIVSMCGHYAFLRVNNPATARWASDLMGQQQVLVRQKSMSTQEERETESVSHRHETRPLVTPTALQQLPLTDRQNGLTGYFKSISHPTYKGHISGKELFDRKGLIKTFPLADYEPRPKEDLRYPDSSTNLARFLSDPEKETKHEHTARKTNVRTKPRINEQIAVSPVRVQDENGAHLGIHPTNDAISLARERGADLVEIEEAGNGKPALCRITSHQPPEPESETSEMDNVPEENQPSEPQEKHEWNPDDFPRLDMF